MKINKASKSIEAQMKLQTWMIGTVGLLVSLTVLARVWIKIFI